MKKEKNLLPYTTIKAVTEGDAMAIQKVLKHYEGYIAKLSTKILSDEYGKEHCVVDKDMQEQLTTAAIKRQRKITGNGSERKGYKTSFTGF